MGIRKFLRTKIIVARARALLNKVNLMWDSIATKIYKQTVYPRETLFGLKPPKASKGKLGDWYAEKNRALWVRFKTGWKKVVDMIANRRANLHTGVFIQLISSLKMFKKANVSVGNKVSFLYHLINKNVSKLSISNKISLYYNILIKYNKSITSTVNIVFKYSSFIRSISKATISNAIETVYRIFIKNISKVTISNAIESVYRIFIKRDKDVNVGAAITTKYRVYSLVEGTLKNNVSSVNIEMHHEVYGPGGA